jgi:hypothetical protein
MDLATLWLCLKPEDLVMDGVARGERKGVEH